VLVLLVGTALGVVAMRVIVARGLGIDGVLSWLRASSTCDCPTSTSRCSHNDATGRITLIEIAGSRLDLDPSQSDAVTALGVRRSRDTEHRERDHHRGLRSEERQRDARLQRSVSD
jgi:hypothetical protein